MRKGKCKLCQREPVELLDSHLLPSAGYKRIRESQQGKTPPVITRERTMVKDDQVSDYVFCAECEGRFNKNGESWVLKNCFLFNKGFPLKQKLDECEPVYSED